MISGGGTSNRIGIKGTEDLGNGYKVKFVLENGFDSDTGAEGSEGLAFSREATLQIESPYGILAAGRSSVLGTDGGSLQPSWKRKSFPEPASGKLASKTSSMRNCLPPAMTMPLSTALRL